LKRRDNGVLLGKSESLMVSIGYKNTVSKSPETPVTFAIDFQSGFLYRGPREREISIEIRR